MPTQLVPGTVAVLPYTRTQPSYLRYQRLSIEIRKVFVQGFSSRPNELIGIWWAVAAPCGRTEERNQARTLGAPLIGRIVERDLRFMRLRAP